MLVFQNKFTGKYVRKVFANEVSNNSAETYRHVDTLEEATVFGGWWDISAWIRARNNLSFGPLPQDWQIVVIELVSVPSRKITGYAG